MKHSLIVLMMAMLGTASAQAESVKPGFDRVGLVTADMKQPLAQRRSGLSKVRFNAAPGGGHVVGDETLPKRRMELARRLVWLMLSAR